VSALLSYEFVIKFFDFLQKRFQSSAEAFANYGCKGLQKSLSAQSALADD
jgi:hypothetical protein